MNVRAWHLDRLAAFNRAVEAEHEAILRGETERTEAGARLVDRFFPHLGNVDREPQPARLPGSAH